MSNPVHLGHLNPHQSDEALLHSCCGAQDAGRPWSFKLVDCVLLHVTNECNLRCVYCNVEAGTLGPRNIMSLSTLDQLLRTLFSESMKKAISVVFHGGEPLLTGLRWLEDAVTLMHTRAAEAGKRLELSIQTNGTIIDDEVAQFFHANGVSVGISLDGPIDLNDVLRGGYNQVRGGMEALSRQGVPFGVICIVSVPIAEKIDHILEFFESEEIWNAQLNFLHNSGRGRNKEKLGEDRMFRVYKAILDHMLAVPPKNLVESHMKRRVLAFSGHRGQMGRISSCNQRICSAGLEFVAVTADGRIFPCGAGIYPKYQLGTVSGLRRPNKADFFRGFFGDDLFKDCASCPAKTMCDYGCMAIHEEDPDFFIDACAATKRLYAYMDSRRTEVKALAQQFVSKALQIKYQEGSRDLERLLALRKKLFDYAESMSKIVCRVSKVGDEIRVQAGDDTTVLILFGPGRISETIDRC